MQDVKYPTRCKNYDDKSNGFAGYCTVDVCDLHDGLAFIEHIGVHMAVILQRCKEHTTCSGIGDFCSCVIVYFVPRSPTRLMPHFSSSSAVASAMCIIGSCIMDAICGATL